LTATAFPVRLPTRESLFAELARRSLADFVRQSWTVLEPTTPLVWNWHIQVVCEHVQALLEGRIPKRNLLINVPPGTMKSRIVSVCAPAWWWILHPSYRFIFASANPRVATRDSMFCRQLLASGWYRRAFRPQWELLGDQNTKTLYGTNRGGFRQAVTVGAKVTGDRADALFGDDLLDAAEGESVVARENVIHWLDHAFLNRLNSMTKGKRCVIGQRLHEGDPYGHLAKSGEWDRLVIRQEFEPEKKDEKDPIKPTALGFTDPRTTAGELLDPIRFPADVLAIEKRRLGSSGYAGQHQQRPTAAEGALFKRAYWRYYKATRAGVPIPTDELLAMLGITRVLVAVDTAMTEEKTADFTALVSLGIAPAKLYLLDLWMEQVEAPEAKKAIVTFSAKWKPYAVVIEGGGSHSGKIIGQELRRETRLPIVEIPNTTDKIVRANIVLPTVEAGVVSLPEDLPWTSDFVDRMAAFPRGLHDDDTDAFDIGVEYAQGGGAGLGMLDWIREEAEAKAAKEKAAKEKATA
jgi:predicted phage terminase large subunit-like protein